MNNFINNNNDDDDNNDNDNNNSNNNIYICVYKVSCIPLNVPRCHAVRCWRRIWEASSSPPSVEMPRCLWTPCFRVRGPSPLGWCKLSRSRYLCTNVGKTLDRVLEVDWGGNGFLFRVLFLKWRFDIFIFGFLTSILPISWGSSSVKDCGANPYSSARKSASSPESVHLRRREALCDSSAEIGCFWWHSAFLQLGAGSCWRKALRGLLDRQRLKPCHGWSALLWEGHWVEVLKRFECWI